MFTILFTEHIQNKLCLQATNVSVNLIYRFTKTED